MNTAVLCSHCGAPARAGAVTCQYCHAALVVPSAAGQSVAGVVAGMPDGVVEALRGGNKINAIRIYQTAKKCSLVEAKNSVEALEKQLGIN